MRQKKTNLVLTLFLLLAFSACGIKGAPTPPQTPFFIGNGKKDLQKNPYNSELKKEDEKKEQEQESEER